MKNPFSFLKESSSTNLPIVTLMILLATVGALLFVGYEHFLGPQTDSLVKAEKLKLDEGEAYLDDVAQAEVLYDSTRLDTVSKQAVDKDSLDKSLVDLEKQKKEAEAEVVPEETIAGKNFTYQPVKGETIAQVAKAFGLTEAQVKSLNPNAKPGASTMQVKVQALHIVGPGDVLRVVAEKYHVSKKSLMLANHKDQDITVRGEQLAIPLK